MAEAIALLLLLGLLFIEIMVWIDEKHSFIWSIFISLSNTEDDKYKDINEKFEHRRNKQKENNEK